MTMKLNLMLAVMALLCAVLLGCTSTKYSQTTTAPDKTVTQSSLKRFDVHPFRAEQIANVSIGKTGATMKGYGSDTSTQLPETIKAVTAGAVQGALAGAGVKP